jgi:hypothetical protein
MQVKKHVVKELSRHTPFFAITYLDHRTWRVNNGRLPNPGSVPCAVIIHTACSHGSCVSLLWRSFWGLFRLLYDYLADTYIRSSCGGMTI